MSTNENIDPRDKIELTNPENLYQIKDKNGNTVDYETVKGRELFNHYRHNMTNYDEVFDEVRQQQGYVNGYQQKKAVTGAAEKVLEKYHQEHVKVIKDSHLKSSLLKKIFNQAKVGTASAVVNLLDDWSEKIQKIGNLESSQRSLRVWNDTYRVQKKLIEKLVKDEDIDPKIAEKIKAIYATRSVNKAIKQGCTIFDLERSQVLKIVKSAIRYAKLVEES